MLSIEQIQLHLDDRKLYEIARGSGVSYYTLWRIVKKREKNVHLSTVRKLSDYLERTARSIIREAK